MVSKKNKYKILVLGWSMVILFLTLSPKGPGSVSFIDIPHFDKIGHFGLFFILAVLIFQIIKPLDKMAKWVGLFSYCSFLGAATEYLQTKVPERSGDVLDFIADIAGSIVAVLIFSNINFRHRDTI